MRRNRYIYTYLVNFLPTILLLVLILPSINAQDFDVQKYALGEKLNFPTGVTFADEGSNHLWLHYRTTENGATVDKLLMYNQAEWAPSTFSICNSCISDFKTGPDGKLWVAASEEGVYRRDNDEWVQVLDIEAKGFDWKENGELIIINSTGAHHYDGNEVTAGSVEGMPEMTSDPHDVVVDRTGDLYLIISSKLYLYNQTSGWTEKMELSAPMNIEVDSENRVWVTDNFGEIGYYQEGIYLGGVYDYFGTDGFDIDQTDVLWYGAEELIRNQDGTELSLNAEDLIDDGIFINSIYVDQNNLVWVASNFKSGIASVRYLGDPTATSEVNIASNISLNPNPVFDQTHLNIDLKERSEVNIQVYNLAGRIISTHRNQLSAGRHVIPLNVTTLRSGIYLVNVSYGTDSKTLKMVKK
ncbi:T9SS type A sorting domain-containing protein [Portibacter lacus]|uniref:Secretion system C-terminal sorting domain-containing protein n=1 Tax=Portibacter lacus TaxID=1099794 RepID=A0AA37WD85_9BACT|nr:T9SS type A sorting domain-containing protein [Portibacter lacus]GLR16558.1 hypothetical protein GCM10007940_11730 [Portibacter lacus]